MKATEHFKAGHNFHKAASTQHAGLAEECDGQGYEKMAECHKNLSKLHADHAEHFKAMHADAAAAADKAAVDELAKSRAALEPSRISGIAPPNLRAIPRTGQPQIEKAVVDPEFEDLIKIDSRNEE
jgi:hypothetical protein